MRAFPFSSVSSLFALSLLVVLGGGCLLVDGKDEEDEEEEDEDQDDTGNDDTDTGSEDSDTGGQDSDTDTGEDSDTGSSGDDADRDGYTVREGDCDDDDRNVNPDADETCNGIDDDCDDDIDEDPVDGALYYTDDDGDGYGAPGSGVLACEGVDNEQDCDDSDAGEPVIVDISRGSSAGTGTYARPVDTIQGGIDLADTCVLVYPGTYSEAIDFSGKSILVASTTGSLDAVIDASGKGSPTVTIASGESSDAMLIGFTLVGGEGYVEETSDSSSCGSGATCYNYYTSYCGGGLYVAGADPVLRDLQILENSLPPAAVTESGNDTYYTYSFGGGACFRSSNSEGALIRFTGNFADHGGGVWISESTVSFFASSFAGNYASNGGGAQVYNGSLVMENAAFMTNSAGEDGGALYLDGSSMTLTNVSFSGDSASAGAGSAAYLSSSAATVDSIIASSSSSAATVAGASSTWSASYSDHYNASGTEFSGITDPVGSTGNISSNPQFTSATDLHLSSSSACINTGNPASASNDADGSRNDMGAYGGPGGSW